MSKAVIGFVAVACIVACMAGTSVLFAHYEDTDVRDFRLMDFLYLTDGNGSIETRKLRVGDEMLGFILIGNYFDGYLAGAEYIDGEFFSYMWTGAGFEGIVTLRGNLVFNTNEWGIFWSTFEVYREYAYLVPWPITQPVNPEPVIRVSIYLLNLENFIHILGLTECNILPLCGCIEEWRSEDVTVTIEDFWLGVSSFPLSSASILSMESSSTERWTREIVLPCRDKHVIEEARHGSNVMRMFSRWMLSVVQRASF